MFGIDKKNVVKEQKFNGEEWLPKMDQSETLGTLPQTKTGKASFLQWSFGSFEL